MEQVLRTVSALNDAGFTSMQPYAAHSNKDLFLPSGVTMYETLLRPQEVSSVALPSIDTVISKLRKAEVAGEERRLRQIELAKVRNKRKREEAASNGVAEGKETFHSNGTSVPPPPKRRKQAESDDVNRLTTMEDGEVEDVNSQNEPESPATSNGRHKPSRQSHNQAGGSSSQIAPTLQVAHPLAEVRGHTSYLTFAVLLPYHHIIKTQTGSTSTQEPQSNTEVDASAGDTTITTEVPTDFSAYDEYFKSIPDAVSFPCRVPWLSLTLNFLMDSQELRKFSQSDPGPDL